MTKGTQPRSASLTLLPYITVALASLGCASSATGNAAEAGAPDVTAVDAATDIPQTDARDASPDIPKTDIAPIDVPADIFADVTASDASVDVETTDRRVRVTADSICGVSVATDGSTFAALYAARVGGRSEVRVERMELPSAAGERSIVLARIDNAAACVGRYSLTSTTNGVFRAAWWNGVDGVEVVTFNRDGAVTARATVRDSTSAAAEVGENNLAIEPLQGAQVSWITRASSGYRLHAARLDVAAGTAEAPIGTRVLDSGSVALPANVESVALSAERVGYTRGLPDSSGHLTSYSLAGGALTLEPPITVTGLGEAPAIAALAQGFFPTGIALATFTSGQRSVTVSYVTSDDLRGTTAAAHPWAIDTAWNRADALPISVSQSLDGGVGIVWASHGGGGYNGQARFGPISDPASRACVVATSPEDRSLWRTFAYAQRGARSKVLAMIRQVSNGVVSRDELVLHHRDDGEGICGL
ncbi:MAG: hypothetical protein U0326_42930 [Polyangiales bacterium]